MEVSEIIKIAGQAADCALRFRITAFTPRPFVNIKAIREKLGSEIRHSSKKHGNNGEIALHGVAEVVGSAVTRAVTEWNEAADVQNHVDADWLRHCVCDLVGGAVGNAACQAAQGYDASQIDEYLDPLNEDDFDGVSDSQEDSNASSVLGDREEQAHGIYGFTQASRDANTGPSTSAIGDQLNLGQTGDLLPTRHQITADFLAINKRASDRATSTPGVKSHAGTGVSSRKRSTPSEDPGDSNAEGSEAGTDIAKQVLKRVCSTAASPTASPRPALGARSHNARQPSTATQLSLSSRHSTWTEGEVRTLVTSREEGMSWDEVHDLLNGRTAGACAKKYRDVLKEKGE